MNKLGDNRLEDEWHMTQFLCHDNHLTACHMRKLDQKNCPANPWPSLQHADTGAKQRLSVLNPWDSDDVLSNIHLAIENKPNNGGKKVWAQAELGTPGLQDQFSFRRKGITNLIQLRILWATVVTVRNGWAHWSHSEISATGVTGHFLSGFEAHFMSKPIFGTVHKTGHPWLNINGPYG